MQNKRVLFIFLSYLNFISLSGSSPDFYKSFIDSYDLSGRYTHEYHPYILEKTRKSFLDLEKYLKDSGFNIDGHKLIFGYQEDGIMPYQTFWARQAIDDEAIVNNHAGLCLPTKNIFGFMTGFVFKDFQWLEQDWLKRAPLIEHVFAAPIDLFNDSALVFQKHAFGEAFDYMIKVRNKLERLVYTRDMKSILRELSVFWSNLYETASKTLSGETVSFQDVLFSIDYAKALSECESRIKNIFIGPDITYPIEVLSIQKQSATAHAQAFVKRIVSDLVPVNGKNTVYVFCSYVDGVGKSTLLNNIKNYQKHGAYVEQYSRCDNSSSQDVDVYKLKDQVFLADLPAQMSHFVIKPEGSVFVDCQTVKSIKASDIKKIKLFVMDNSVNFINKFKDTLLQVSQTINYLYEYENCLDQYAQNCFVLGVDPIWIPFEFEDNYYLFNKNNISEFRILVSLADAHSIGLKNIEPEQMLFNKGLSLSKQYELFLADLKSKLVDCGVEQVVFVDFLSMYPRSSRENIRVNFVLQYLKKIYGSSYDFSDTFYQHWAYKEQEICHQLVSNFDSTCHALTLETALRWSLFDIGKDVACKDIINIDKRKLEKKLHSATDKIIEQYYDEIKNKVYQRLDSEKQLYQEAYGKDLAYNNIVRFSFEPLFAFSSFVSTLWDQLVDNNYFNTLWSDLGSLKVVDKVDDIELEVKFKVSKQCKDENKLSDFSNLLRAQFYAILSNLLEVRVYDNQFVLDKVSQYVPPIVVVPSSDGDACILQKRMLIMDDQDGQLEPPIKFHLMDMANKKKKWGLFCEVPHCLDWSNPGTFFGIYAFGYYPFSSNSKGPKDKNSEQNLITNLVEEYYSKAVKSNLNFGVSVVDLLKHIDSDNLWQHLKKTGKQSVEIIKNDPRLPAIRLWLRSTATLEMILKDLRSRILIRKGDKKDFIATIKLLEIITLPNFFGLSLSGPAFQDYELIDPVISWDLLK